MIIHPLFNRLQQGVLILDGAVGTLLQQRGLPPGYPPDLCNLEYPQAVIQVHSDYLRAGSDMLLTNTFGATRLRLGKYAAERHLGEINRRGVDLARRAGGEDTLVAGDVGPCATASLPFASLPFDQAIELFYEQIKVFQEEGCDLIALETMRYVQEVEAAVVATREVGGVMPVMALMSFGGEGLLEGGKDGAAVARALADLGVAIVGANCSFGPKPMLPVIEGMVGAVPNWVCAKPNAGLPDPQARGGRIGPPISPREWADFGPAFVEAGASLVGGCCGTTPEGIALLASHLKGLKPREREALETRER